MAAKKKTAKTKRRANGLAKPSATESLASQIEAAMAELEDRLVTLRTRNRHKEEVRKFIGNRLLTRGDLREIAMGLPLKLPPGALNGAPKPPSTVGKQPAKYRHPDDPALTWSGFGHTPLWLKKYLAANKRHTREDLLITEG